MVEARSLVLPAPTLLSSVKGERPGLAASGSWTATFAGDIDALIGPVLEEAGRQRTLDLDMHDVQHFDTFGAYLLERLVREAHAHGIDVQVTGLPPHFAELARAVSDVRKAPKPPEQPRPLMLQKLENLGRATAGIGQDLFVLLNTLGAAGHALMSVLRKPSTFRLTSTVHHLDRVAWQAVPIILLITFLIGGIIAQQGFFHFRKFGADQYVVDMVGILVLREIGVLIVAIMVAGRSGSSYTAELGSMKMREEIDALRTMGLDPVSVLILPRLVALLIGLPILAFLGSMSALIGGGVIAWSYGDMNPAIFIARLKEAISMTHFKVGMIKAPFMALVIGLVACSEGLKVQGSAESLGLQTTASVVKSIFLVIVLDGLFAIYFASIGM
jgi:phospholipid/cholesterol/gamma-HCH transport system permease protein